MVFYLITYFNIIQNLTINNCRNIKSITCLIYDVYVVTKINNLANNLKIVHGTKIRIITVVSLCQRFK